MRRFIAGLIARTWVVIMILSNAVAIQQLAPATIMRSEKETTVVATTTSAKPPPPTETNAQVVTDSCTLVESTKALEDRFRVLERAIETCRSDSRRTDGQLLAIFDNARNLLEVSSSIACRSWKFSLIDRITGMRLLTGCKRAAADDQSA